MEIKKILPTIVKKLSKQTIIDQPELEAEILLSFILDNNRQFILSNPNYELSDNQTKKLERLLNRRLKGEPIAYIIGHKEFYGLDFSVNKDVLIPRPETELLVDLALGKIELLLPNFKETNIIDVGTGSGCIPISIAKNITNKDNISISASDISKKALNIARKNAKKHKALIKFNRSNLLDNINDNFHLIIANLPYIHSNQANSIAKLLHHPKLSLDGGKDGLDLIKKLINQSKEKLTEKGTILLEIAPEQKEEVYFYARKIFHLPKLSIHKDLAGLDRVAEIRP